MEQLYTIASAISSLSDTKMFSLSTGAVVFRYTAWFRQSLCLIFCQNNWIFVPNSHPLAHKLQYIVRNTKNTTIYSGVFTWRRRRDSNPRTAFNGYTISNRARSTSYATSPSILNCLHNGYYFITISCICQVFLSFFQIFFKKKGCLVDSLLSYI